MLYLSSVGFHIVTPDSHLLFFSTCFKFVLGKNRFQTLFISKEFNENKWMYFWKIRSRCFHTKIYYFRRRWNPLKTFVWQIFFKIIESLEKNKVIINISLYQGISNSCIYLVTEKIFEKKMANNINRKEGARGANICHCMIYF